MQKGVNSWDVKSGPGLKLGKGEVLTMPATIFTDVLSRARHWGKTENPYGSYLTWSLPCKQGCGQTTPTAKMGKIPTLHGGHLSRAGFPEKLARKEGGLQLAWDPDGQAGGWG